MDSYISILYLFMVNLSNILLEELVAKGTTTHPILNYICTRDQKPDD